MNAGPKAMAAVLVALALGLGWSGEATGQAIELFEGQDEVEGDEEGAGPIIEGGRSDGDSSGAAGRAGRSGPIELEMVERSGTKMVELSVNGQDAYWMVDTGASYTTLSSDFARQVRAQPPANAPSTQMQTAGGVRSAQFGIIDRMELGRKRLQGVSYTVCDACAMGQVGGAPVVGLLGMNVLGRFGLEIDDDAGVLRLRPTGRGQARDIEPWLGIDAGDEPGQVTVVNRSPRRMQGLEVRLVCRAGGGEGMAGSAQSLGTIRPRGRAAVEVHRELAGCPMPGLEVLDGRW